MDNNKLTYIHTGFTLIQAIHVSSNERLSTALYTFQSKSFFLDSTRRSSTINCEQDKSLNFPLAILIGN